MSSLGDFAEDSISDFIEVARIANLDIARDKIEIEFLAAPHKPPSNLPAGKMAVYSFFLNGDCLKVGKVGQNSSPRFTSQHYNPKSAPSTLANSILSSPVWVERHGLDESNIKSWMRTNTDRINILLPASLGAHSRTLLEGFLQCRWRPKFEGRSA